MNRTGQLNLPIKLLLFFIGLATVMVFVSPMNTFLEMGQDNDSFNCPGYIDESATSAQNGSYDPTQNTNELGCMTNKLVLPFILFIVIIGGVSWLLYDRSPDFTGGSG